MAYCDINGCRYYYELAGQGEPLVLIRGLGSNADHWYPQLPALSKEHRVLVFDNRGIARTSDRPGAYSIAGMAEDTVALMEAAGLEDAHVLGLSMGGMIVQEMAINFQDRIRSCILCVTHCGGRRQIQPEKGVLDRLMTMIHEPSEAAKKAAAAIFFASETLEKRPELAAKYAEISLRHPVPTEILVRQWEALLEFDAWDRLPQISAPTLVLGADQDELIPPKNSDILAQRIPNAEQVVVKGGGHQVLIEQADACNDAILDFLKD